VHGSNRLGTNSLLDINVFGKRAGSNAVEYVKTVDFTPLPADPASAVRNMLGELRDSNGTERIAAIRKELQDEMDKNAQVFRTDESLAHVTEVIAGLRDRYRNVAVQDKGKRFNTDLLEAWELGNLLDLAQVTTESAINRTESRGGHMREDFQQRNDAEWLKHTLAYRDAAGEIELRYKPVTITKFQPKERVY